MAGVEATAIGPRIRRLRRLRGWSQATLAERSGITVEGLSRFERSVQLPRVDTLMAIAAGLQVEPAALLQEEADGGDRAVGTLARDLELVLEPLLDQPPEVRATAARLVRALVNR